MRKRNATREHNASVLNWNALKVCWTKHSSACHCRPARPATQQSSRRFAFPKSRYVGQASRDKHQSKAHPNGSFNIASSAPRPNPSNQQPHEIVKASSLRSLLFLFSPSSSSSLWCCALCFFASFLLPFEHQRVINIYKWFYAFLNISFHGGRV